MGKGKRILVKKGVVTKEERKGNLLFVDEKGDLYKQPITKKTKPKAK